MHLISMWLRLVVLALFCNGALAADSATAPAPSPNHGYVFVSFPGAEPINPLFLRTLGDTLTLRSLADGSDHRLVKMASRDGNTFGMWLPAGDYKIYKWRDQLMTSYPTVTVAAGRLTDMGSLVSVPVGDNQFVLLPIRNAETARKAEAAIGDLPSGLQSPQPNGWLVDRVPAAFRPMEDPENRFGLIPLLLMFHETQANAAPINKRLRATTAIDEFLALAKASTPPQTPKAVGDAKGRSYFGAALGQVRVRDAQGTWTSLDTGSLHNVTAVAAWGDMLLAGFENGLIRLSTDAGTSWKLAAALDRGLSVTDISRVGDHWLVTGAHGIVLRNGMRSVDLLTVHAARAADLSDLAKQRDIAMESEPLVRPSAAAYQNFYYVNAFPKLWRLDVSTMQWRALGPDTDIHGFQITPGNGTLAAYRIKGGFSKLFVSTDRGETWTKYDNPPYVIMDIRFNDDKDGQAVRWNTGAFSGAIELLRYDRAKDSWTKSADAPVGCKAMLPDGSNTARFCITRGGDVLTFADGKWKAEFAVD